jgi:hypothetical protein
MIKQLLITGYYKKQNTGDDFFNNIAEKIFPNNKRNYKTTIKSIDEIKNDINSNINYDAIVLFGGETLNEYFLNPLSKIKELNQNIKLYAMGVNLGTDIDYIKKYLIMFQYIIVRNTNDYNKIKEKFNNFIPCFYIQDIVFINYIKGYKLKTIENCIGLFLSQPKNKNEINMDNYINIINYYINNNYTVKLFSMCYSDSNTESDKILNNKIFDLLPLEVKKKVLIIPDNNFGKHIKTLKYAICERFHAHILTLIYNIPFVSLANTGKVKQLLEDLNIDDLLLTNYDPIIINNKLKSINTKKLKNIYKKIYPDVENFYAKLKYEDLDNIPNLQFYYPKNKTKYYFNNNIINKQSTKIFNKYKTTNEILMRLFGTTKLDYKWGLEEKIKKDLLVVDDIKWLYEQSIYNHYYLHYYNSKNNSMNNSKNIMNINIDYIDQYDRSNCHRSGWRYVVDNINNQLATFDKDALKLDLYVDRTFHWCCDEMVNSNIIPYTTNWFGIIHHTMYQDESNYNCIELLKNKYFIESLKTCKGLIFLSNYLKENFKKLAKINNIELPQLYNFYHPAEFTDKLWNYNKWKGEVIQIGTWMRDLNTIYELNYNNKYVLVKKDAYDKYICYTNTNNSYSKNNNIELIQHVDNNQYDELLSKYVVFIKLYDASAVNTLIECIVRNTPIIINKLPAVVEYLGPNYPLYYNNIDEVPRLLKIKFFTKNHIKNAHKYLKNMNKDFLKIENFIKLLKK